MATSPIRNTRRDPQTGRATSDSESEVPLGGMQEPMGTMERPLDTLGERRDNVNIHNTTAASRSERGFGTTFAIAAVVLLLAFLVALYLGMSGPDTTATSTAPADGLAPTIETTPNTTGQIPDTTTTVPATPTQPDTTGQVPVPDTGTGTTGTTGSTGTTNP